MIEKKLTQYTTIASVNSDALMMVVIDPTTNPKTRTINVGAFKGYDKRYLVQFNQSGTAIPTIDTIDNTIGSIVWARASAGNYDGTLAGAFLAAKTILPNPVILTDANGVITGTITVSRTDDNTIRVKVRNTGGNGIDLNGSFILLVLKKN